MKLTSLHPVLGEFTFPAKEGFALESGGRLCPATVHYAIYGEPNATRDNIVLVCHALSGSAEVADWWPELVAEGGLLGLDRYCVIGMNILGSCYGTTGPQSVNGETGKPYGRGFPLVSISDIVRAEAAVLDALHIRRLKLVIGGSIGGMQALHWAIDYPERVENCIAIGAAPIGAMALALNHIQRQAIQLDPKWRNGEYPIDDPPAEGLSIARQIGMCSYKSIELFAQRYGRKPNRGGEDPWSNNGGRFDVAGYLDHQGKKFNHRFDANSYISITRTMDTFDPARQYGSADTAYRRIRAKVTLVGISSDWLFPPEEVRALADTMTSAGVSCVYRELRSRHGHDAFLAEPHSLAQLLGDGEHIIL